MNHDPSPKHVCSTELNAYGSAIRLIEGFTNRYNMKTLVYFESFNDPSHGITREKQIKTWRREKKLRLIERENPEWRDLSDGWYD